MFRFVALSSILVVCVTLLAQSPSPNSHGYVLVPDTSVEQAADVGRRAHTNHLVFVRPDKGGGGSPSGQTPASIRSIYFLNSSVTYGGAGVIAIVDAYDYPTAANDLKSFNTAFGLPATPSCSGVTSPFAPCFSVVYASGQKPKSSCGWAQEAALDIEWAHAMAPQAKIVLVEAASASFSDLFAAVDVATSIVQTGQTPGGAVVIPAGAGQGVGEVSMSWGGSEFSSEATSDSHFSAGGNVVYFGASGDNGGATIYPSASPYVVAAGGTTLNFKNGSFFSETGWSGSGGGPSKYEPKPSYQTGIANTDPSKRSVPDLSFDADPASGVSVYDSTPCQGMTGWMVFGGTSVSSPALAGVINSAASAGGTGFASGSFAELQRIYSNYTNTAEFRDIIFGSAGKYPAVAGWDFVTGVGSSLGYQGK